jgi:hypothetical protein
LLPKWRGCLGEPGRRKQRRGYTDVSVGFSNVNETLTALPILRDALLTHAAANEVSGERCSIDGTRYEIDGPLLACDGRAPAVRVVWYIRTGEDFPWLVTLIPRRIAGR